MENTINLHSLLTQYFNDSNGNHTKKFVRVTFTNVDSPLIIILDTDMYLWYVFEGKKNQYPSVVSINKIQTAESIWTSLSPIGDYEIQNSRVNHIWHDGCSRYLRAFKKRLVIVPDVVNNTNIANVELIDLHKLPIQWPANYE